MLTDKLDHRFYPGIESHWDDTLFRESIMERLSPHDRILDLGAGAGIIQQMNFKGHVAHVCGIDPDPRVMQNPYLDHAAVGVGQKLPYPSNDFDLVFSDNVLEHLSDPVPVSREVHRVLRPGGRFLFKTPNRKHYVPLIARLTPHWFHQFYNMLRARAADDTFPTVYKANTPEDITRIAQAAGLQVGAIRLVESRPEYLRLNPLLYLLGIAWERTVNRWDGLARFRVLLMGELVKPQQRTALKSLPGDSMTLDSPLPKDPGR